MQHVTVQFMFLPKPGHTLSFKPMTSFSPSQCFSFPLIVYCSHPFEQVDSSTSGLSLSAQCELDSSGLPTAFGRHRRSIRLPIDHGRKSTIPGFRSRLHAVNSVDASSLSRPRGVVGNYPLKAVFLSTLPACTARNLPRGM